MSEKKVDKTCIICHTELSVGDAVYAVNVKLVDDSIGYHKTPEDQLRVIFKNSKNPKGAMHKECWNVHFGQHSEDNKKTKLTMNTNRLDTID